MARDFFEFLATSMTILEREAPASFAGLRASLGGLRARLTADATTRVVQFGPSRLSIYADTHASDVDAIFDRRVILELIDGATTLDQAILDDALHVRGPVRVVERFYDGVCCYVDAAVRSPSFVPLLDAYRDDSTR